jgi:hypothetical protein
MPIIEPLKGLLAITKQYIVTSKQTTVHGGCVVDPYDFFKDTDLKPK